MLEITEEQKEQARESNKLRRAEKLNQYLDAIKGMDSKERLLFKAKYEIDEYWDAARRPLPMRVVSQRYNRTAKRLFGSYESFLIELQARYNMEILTTPRKGNRFIITDEQLASLGVMHGSLDFETFLGTLERK